MNQLGALMKLWNAGGEFPATPDFLGVKDPMICHARSVSAGVKMENRTRQTASDAMGETTHARDEYTRRQDLSSKGSRRALVTKVTG